MITVTLGGAGSKYVGFFGESEIDEASNSFFDEVGSTSGTPAAGQSREIDEPGYVFGDICENFGLSALDNSIGTLGPDDVSMAMAWHFVLADGEAGLVSFLISYEMPTSGFLLIHTDPDSQVSAYLSSRLTVRERQIPEPATAALLGLGFLSPSQARRRRSAMAQAGPPQV